ncbi:MAG: patatin-like phospholipase family protein [Alphaproteobacteria bacterium]
MTKRPRVGIALGSGAARGWSHIGVLQALEEEGIEPEIVCGSSMGALVGAAYVAGELKALEDWARTITWWKIVGFLDVNLSSGGLIEGKRIMNFLRTLKEDAPIESFSKPFTAIATDLNSGREVWLQKGSISAAVRASVALPGIFSPVKSDGRWLLDGGLVNPVPVSACRAMGAEIIIAVNLNADVVGRHTSHRLTKTQDATDKSPLMGHLDKLLKSAPPEISNSIRKIVPQLIASGEDAPGYFDVGASAINIMQDQITRSRLAGEPPHIMLMPRLGHIGLLDFGHADKAIAEGYECVRQALPALRRFVPQA